MGHHLESDCGSRILPTGEYVALNTEFEAEIWFWQGPAPWFFVTVPKDLCDELAMLSASVTYGWGMIPATVRIGNTTWKTSLFPKDGQYIVPIKAMVRKAEKLDEGDRVTVTLEVV